nr:hypothetical protein [Citrobacter freundii]
MSKAIFLGDSLYPWLGMREILRGSALFTDITYHSSQTLSAVNIHSHKEGANKRGNSSRLTQSFHFFMFEPIFSPVNALNQPI